MATVTFIKYEKQSAGAMSGVTAYVAQEAKTVREDEQQLVSGQNCNPQLAYQEFLATRAMHRKKSPVWFYHYVQSFAKDEPVTGELAHEVAKEFAAGAWPESEVLIATHIDREHIHSHFIVNSVCIDSGKMLRQGPSTLSTLRPLSDEICTAHGLSVLPKQKQAETQGLSTREYRAAAKGESWKFRLMNTIDGCMKYAHTREEFVALMQSEGYGVRWETARKSITYTTPGGYKCRDDRLHDVKYLKEAMEREFGIRQSLDAGGVEAAQLIPNRSPAERVRFGKEERRSGRAFEPARKRVSAVRDDAVGKEKESRRSRPRLRLPSIRISPAWLWLIPILTALYALVSSSLALWTAFSTMFP